MLLYRIGATNEASSILAEVDKRHAPEAAPLFGTDSHGAMGVRSGGRRAEKFLRVIPISIKRWLAASNLAFCVR